jgi:hypothetical protein
LAFRKVAEMGAWMVANLAVMKETRQVEKSGNFEVAKKDGG